MPAAAVIPAPIAYTNVVAVKKLVVEFLSCLLPPALTGVCDTELLILLKNLCGIHLSCRGSDTLP